MHPIAKNVGKFYKNFKVHKENTLLQYNIFEHDYTPYRQQIRKSMGSKPPPNFSNIFMARRINYEIRKIAKNLLKEIYH